MDNKVGEKGLVPIVIGITGHRDIHKGNIGVLKKRIRQLINQFREDYPDTPLIMISPLAEGADRIAASVSVEMGVSLVVPLPFHVDEYMKDFSNNESCDEFKQLLLAAENSFVLPLVEGCSNESVQADACSREKQYALVGAYVARQCHILLALWDGKDTKKTGGTSQIVNFRLSGIMNGLPLKLKDTEEWMQRFDLPNPLDLPETGPVFHLKIVRQDEDSNLSNEDWLKYYPFEVTEVKYKLILKKINGFNVAITSGNITEKEYLSSRESLVPSSMQDKFAKVREKYNKNNLSTIDRMMEAYINADVLALKSQRGLAGVIPALRLIAIMAMIMVLSYEIYAHVWHGGLMLWIYLGAFIFGLSAYYFVRLLGNDKRYLDYRALAEGIRIQFYWLIGGLRENVHHHYLRKYHSELDWIREAFKGISINNISCECDADYALVQKAWIENQGEWFTSKIKENKSKTRKTMLEYSFLATLAITFTSALLVTMIPDFAVMEPVRNEILIVLMGLLPAGAAVYEHYSSKMAFEEHEKQYELMAHLFTRAKDQLDNTDNGLQAKRIIFEIGKEALAGNGDWLLIHRDRVIEPPKA
ncbi:MAG: hypothetical protein GXP13_06330 [Gammaproteobacteria bacterium]|nr:hypothetical protein [Gammaproteobacteria bacterium]